MKFVRLDPPGTLCHHEAVFDLLQKDQPGRFIDVGCGQGSIAGKLIARGWRGIGVDFSPDSIEACAPRAGGGDRVGQDESRPGRRPAG